MNRIDESSSSFDDINGNPRLGHTHNGSIHNGSMNNLNASDGIQVFDLTDAHGDSNNSGFGANS